MSNPAGAVKYDQEVHQSWLDKVKRDRFAGWRALLAGEDFPIIEAMPYSGYYRTRRRDKTLAPVAIWYDESGDLCCLEDGQLISADTARERWRFYAQNPIEYSIYQAVAELHQEWPDADKAVTREAIRGDNKAPALKESEELAQQIENASGGVVDYEKIADIETFAKAQSLRARLLELTGKADHKREALKRPHLNANREIDDEWMPVVRSGTAAAAKIKVAMEAFQTEQRAAERRKLAAEAAKAPPPVTQAGNEPPDEAAQTAPTPPTQPSMPAPVRGAYGRAASTKFKNEVTEITDPFALFAFICGAENPPGSKQYPRMHPEMKEFLITLAKRALAANLEPPGVKIEEKAKVT